MKKNFDYEQTEKWLSEKISASEQHLKYGGGALGSIDKKSGRGSFFQYSAVRIAGAFLALVLIGGSLFGALKLLERIGSRTDPSHGVDSSYDTDTTTDPPEETEESILISDINGIKTYDYEKKLEKLQKASYDGDPSDFVRVLTGGELYTAPVGRAYDAKRQTAVKHYDFDADPPVMEFGGDLQLYNNVTDKQMDIISVSVILPDGKKSGGSLTNVFREIYAGKAGTYVVKACVSWDKDPEASRSDEYTVYCVYFALHKSESYDGIDKVWYSEGKQKYNCRYYTVFSAGDYCYPYMPCKKYVKMKSDNVTGQKGFDDEHLLLGEIHIPYSGSFEILNNVYDREMTVISLTVKDGAGTETETTIDELKEYLKSADAGTYCVSLLLTWDTYPVLTKGDEAYIYTSSFYVEKSDNVTDAMPGETAAEETTGPEEQSIEFSPLGMISIIWKVRNTVCKVYNPPVMQKRAYKDGAIVEELSYDSDPCDVEYRYTDSLAAENKSYLNVWRVFSVTVNKEKEFKSFETAFEYIHDLAENSSGTAYVEATVTWDAGALLNRDADRTEYTYAFNVVYMCPDDIDRKADPYVTDVMKRWLAVRTGGERYNPGVSKKLVYNGDRVTEQEYYHDHTGIQWIPGETINISNEIYTMCRFYGVTVNGEKYDNAEQALAALPTDRTSHVEVEASWAVVSPAVISNEVESKTTYIFEFDIEPVTAK